MVSVRHSVPLDARVRAEVVLEREGPAVVLGALRSDLEVTEVRWRSGGRTQVLRDGLERLVRDFSRSGDPAAGLALVWLAQALVIARLDEGPEVRP